MQLDTEHLLLGMLKEQGCLAVRLLDHTRISRFSVDQQARKLARAAQRPPEPARGKLKVTPAARYALELAFDEARRREQSRVGTEDVLVGLLREEKGNAARVLVGLGLTIRSARQELAALLRADAAARAV